MSLDGSVVAFVVITAALAPLIFRLMVRNTYDEMETARWIPAAPLPEHRRLGPTVEALVAEGYVVDSWSRIPAQPRSLPAVVLLHPDGSLATVMLRRPLIVPGVVLLTVESRLAAVYQDLATTSFGGVIAPAHALVQVAARPVDVGATVARHREAARALSERGIALDPYRPGDVPGAVEEGMRRAAIERPRASFLRVLGRQLTGGGRYRRPLLEQAGIEDRLATIRDQQASAAVASP